MVGVVTRVVIIQLLTKGCSQCCSVINVRKLKCPCGHSFVTKCSKPVLTMSSLHSLHEHVIQLDHMTFTHIHFV